MSYVSSISLLLSNTQTDLEGEENVSLGHTNLVLIKMQYSVLTSSIYNKSCNLDGIHWLLFPTGWILISDPFVQK